MTRKEKVLVYRRGAIGDTLLTFPLLEVLKKLNYEVLVVGNTDVYSLAKLVGFADAIYTELYRELLDGVYQKKIFISKDGNLPPFPTERIWLPLYYLNSLGLPTDFSLSLTIPRHLAKEDFKDRWIIHPGSGSRLKNAPLSLFTKIKAYLEEKKNKVLFLAGPNEGWLKGDPKEVYYTTDPLDLALRLVVAKGFIGNDSGLAHLAAYLGLPTFVIFGPTDETIFHPIGRAVVILKLDLPCRPCYPKVCLERPCLAEEELLAKFVKFINL